MKAPRHEGAAGSGTVDLESREMDSVRSRRLQSLSRWASGQAGSRRLEIKGNPHQGSVARVSKVPDQRWGLGRISGQIPGQAAADEE